MPVKHVTREMRDERRRAVAALRLKGAHLGEIIATLHTRGFDNPCTGKRWATGTISQDLTFLKAEWRKAASRSTRDMLHPIRAEIRLHRRSAWAKGDLMEVRLSLGQEIDLLGLAAPAKVEVSDTSLLALIMSTARQLPAEEIHEGDVEEAPLIEGAQ